MARRRVRIRGFDLWDFVFNTRKSGGGNRFLGKTARRMPRSYELDKLKLATCGPRLVGIQHATYLRNYVCSCFCFLKVVLFFRKRQYFINHLKELHDQKDSV